jgi:hypothetical protein
LPRVLYLLLLLLYKVYRDALYPSQVGREHATGVEEQ